MSKRFIGILISILAMLPTFCMTSISAQAAPALYSGLARIEVEWRDIDAHPKRGGVISDPGQRKVSGDAITYAQEGPEDYPGPEPVNEDAEGSLDTTPVETNNDLAAPTDSGDNPDKLEIVGDEQYPAEDLRSDSDFEVQIPETAVPSGGLAGKIYIWVAFIAALVIFTAAILGAILLYTRQRSQE